MLDTSFLPEADLEFVILPDTHHVSSGQTEFEFTSRAHQNDRIRYTIDLINQIHPAFVIHLGDVVQAFPGSPDFGIANEEACRLLSEIAANCVHVAGNHDVGDKPDPTMPTATITQESLDAYHDRFGPSWFTWESHGITFVIINSQLLNATLPAAEEQRRWLEHVLSEATGTIALFSHLPPYLFEPNEPDIGHYDNIGNPARERLLETVAEHEVDWWFAGHSHFHFYNRFESTDLIVVPSPSFTRPGFGELFSSCPPPERGRDDRPKLRFYLVRLVKNELQPLFVRTGGKNTTGTAERSRHLQTRRTASLAGSPLGISTLGPISETTTIPAVFPSTTPHRVTNNYPIEGCLQLGVRYLRTNVRNVFIDRQVPNLEWFRRNGGHLVGTALVHRDRVEPPDIPDVFDSLELCVTAKRFDARAIVEALTSYHDPRHREVSVSIVSPDQQIGGKQHRRHRVGFDPNELDEFNNALDDRQTTVDRVLCRRPMAAESAHMYEEFKTREFERISQVDWLVTDIASEVDSCIPEVIHAIVECACHPRSRVFLEPLRGLDRTMDITGGILDRRCNPTPAYHVIRSLNTVLFSCRSPWRARTVSATDDCDTYILTRNKQAVAILVPKTDDGTPIERCSQQVPNQFALRKCIHLPSGTVNKRSEVHREECVGEPMVFLFDR